MSKNTKEWIIDILVAVLIALLILQFIKPTIVKEHSMENTLLENDYLFVSRKAYTWFGKAPKRGDIIVFESDLTTANGKDKLLVKRVIAVAGDTIEISNGNVILNGQIILEDYIKDGYTSGEVAETLIPEGYVFAMGDNRLVSMDSRDSRVGLVGVDTIKGKAVVRLFPFNRFGSIYK